MRTIKKEIDIYRFGELGVHAKGRVQTEIGDDILKCQVYDWRYDFDSPHKDTIEDIASNYCDNSQGPYWGNYGEGIEALFSDWFTDHKGEIRKILNASREDLHPIERAFLEDCDTFYNYLAWDSWDGSLFYDGDKWERFYARNLLSAINEWHYSNWEWTHSEEYISEHCEANELWFYEDGQEYFGVEA